MGIFEILSMTPEVRGAIGDNAPPVEIRRLAVAAGMATMRHDGLRKAAQGLTTIEEVMQVTSGLTG
jgi:type II secretory ATPase GspE/PulE/Tfp pilus assembly ATPase PilB-like protein